MSHCCSHEMLTGREEESSWVKERLSLLNLSQQIVCKMHILYPPHQLRARCSSVSLNVNILTLAVEWIWHSLIFLCCIICFIAMRINIWHYKSITRPSVTILLDWKEILLFEIKSLKTSLGSQSQHALKINSRIINFVKMFYLNQSIHF